MPEYVATCLFGLEHLLGEEIDALGEGGLCLNCAVCSFPNCGFGKGC